MNCAKGYALSRFSMQLLAIHRQGHLYHLCDLAFLYAGVFGLEARISGQE